MTKSKTIRRSESHSQSNGSAPVANGVVMLTAPLRSESENRSPQQMMDCCEEAIRELAYLKWEDAGCPSGDGFDFWLEAERIVLPARAAVLPPQP